MSLPAHVRGWNIPPTESRSGLTVVRATGPWGWRYEAGVLESGRTQIDPMLASAWVEGSRVSPGVTMLDFKTAELGRREYHAAAALLHFCIEADELGQQGTITVPRLTMDRLEPDSLIVLGTFGFAALHEAADMVGRTDVICEYTSGKFPEFAQAAPIL